MKCGFIIINGKLCYWFPYSPDFPCHHLISTWANRLSHSWGDVYCHQESKSSFTPVTEESTGEWEVAWSTVKAAQGPDADAPCAPAECAETHQSNASMLTVSHWQSLSDNAFRVLSNWQAGALWQACFQWSLASLEPLLKAAAFYQPPHLKHWAALFTYGFCIV